MTEVVYRLGVGDRLVGADPSSTYSEAATRLPQDDKNTQKVIYKTVPMTVGMSYTFNTASST